MPQDSTIDFADEYFCAELCDGQEHHRAIDFLSYYDSGRGDQRPRGDLDSISSDSDCYNDTVETEVLRTLDKLAA
jgi:hypothetical protein